eukprot:COSAG05_NODE_716_length_7804_cov_2.669825_2_plen_61_part_00
MRCHIRYDLKAEADKLRYAKAKAVYAAEMEAWEAERRRLGTVEQQKGDAIEALLARKVRI